MAEIHRLPDPEGIEQEASDWLARLNSDGVTPGDRARFQAWYDAHPAHARTFEAMSAAWRAFRAAGPLVRAVSFGEAMNAASSADSAAVAVRAAQVTTRRRLVAGALAATAALAAVSLYWAHRLPETRFQTAIGEHASVALPDGSSVELNSASAVRVDYTEHARLIHLERGEAFFTVAHDTARPFWVVGGGTWVRAVGTAFNVYLRGADTLVTVSEGIVQVGSADDTSTHTPTPQDLAHEPASVLSAGQQVALEHGAASIRTLQATDLKRSIAWRSGKLSFDQKPLGTVIDEVGRYTTLRLVITDNKLRALPVGGTFQASPQGAETLLSLLQDGFRLNVRRDGDRVYISEDANRAEN